MNWLRRLREAPVTSALIAVNLVVYAVMAAVGRKVVSFDSETLVLAGAAVYDPRVHATAWRWLTAAFIHVNLLHIVMNLWVLAQIGVLSEKAIGRGLFAATYLLTGFSGNALSMLLAASRGQAGSSAGASGAIMGLIGLTTAFAWLTGQRRIARALAFNIVFVLAVGFSLTARQVVAVDNAAHVGGLVLGIVIGVVRARVPWSLPRWLDITLLVVCAALTATGFAVVHAYGGER